MNHGADLVRRTPRSSDSSADLVGDDGLLTFESMPWWLPVAVVVPFALLGILAVATIR